MQDVAIAQSRRHPLPGVLRHLIKLTSYFPHDSQQIPYIHVYAAAQDDGSLLTISAKESGYEGIACLDDVARAAILALEAYTQSGSRAALFMADMWLRFVCYVQDADGHFTNFILNPTGIKHYYGQTSYLGGSWWTARALWSLAMATRITGDPRWQECFMQGHPEITGNLKILGVQTLAFLELYEAEPSADVRFEISRRCEALMDSGPGYLRDHLGEAAVEPYGFHQLPALARAGRLLARPEYLIRCGITVDRLIVPMLQAHFQHALPWRYAPRCAYDISTLVLGLEELYHATGEDRYRRLALRCATWLYGGNPAATRLYDARTGRCSDGITADGTASSNCGAESAIEGGFIELARRRLRLGRAATAMAEAG
jgi:hypothetical protein